jgi:hypothetical protein
MEKPRAQKMRNACQVCTRPPGRNARADLLIALFQSINPRLAGQENQKKLKYKAGRPAERKL